MVIDEFVKCCETWRETHNRANAPATK
jgi:hypothetical protein